MVIAKKVKRVKKIRKIKKNYNNKKYLEFHYINLG